MKNTSKLILVYIFILLLSLGCDKKPKYNLLEYYSQNEVDTLMTNILTYVAKKPKTADWKTRHEPRFRKYYIQQVPQFQMKYFHITEDSIQYYYMIRPARSNNKGTKRGAGGKFVTGSNLEISDFEEIFNTPVMATDSLEIIGEKLFSEMVEKGNIDQFINNKKLVEWPDERLKYDKTINEWVYLN